MRVAAADGSRPVADCAWWSSVTVNGHLQAASAVSSWKKERPWSILSEDSANLKVRERPSTLTAKSRSRSSLLSVSRDRARRQGGRRERLQRRQKPLRMYTGAGRWQQRRQRQIGRAHV